MELDATTTESPAIQFHNILEQPILPTVTSPVPTFQRQQRHCFGDANPGEFPLSANPSIVLHVLTACNLDARDLASLEATCAFFRQPANFDPNPELCLAELAALDMCQKRVLFKPMTAEEREEMKQRCGGSWKLVLRFLLIGETCSRREKAQAIAGPGHSIIVTSNGDVYSFGMNDSGELGLGTTEGQRKPCQIRSLQGIRIIQAAVGDKQTMVVSDSGQVYIFGTYSFGEARKVGLRNKQVSTPQLVDSLKNIFVVQVAIGNYFTAVLSREGRVYTLAWGKESKLCHQSALNGWNQPYPLLGALENIPVVHISAGNCFMLALAYQPIGMSVYSVGCGLGGKLGHGSTDNEDYPRLIEHFQTINFQPVMVTAGPWHSIAVGKDGRVCTWGWSRYGNLGHGNGDDHESVPTIIESLSNIKAVNVAIGNYTTFVVSDEGDVYSFGYEYSASLGHEIAAADGQDNGDTNVRGPKIVACLKEAGEKVVQINTSSSGYGWRAHTFALTESGKLYAFGAGDQGQLGVQLPADQKVRWNPKKVDLDLS